MLSQSNAREETYRVGKLLDEFIYENGLNQ